VEQALSKEAIQKGGKKETETHILEVWGKYYSDALAKMDDLQTEANTARIIEAIAAAQKAVEARTLQAIGGL
jgi:aminopeptidase YwaD